MGERKIVAIIPARGGSKGIPRKNLVLIHGRPLIDYSIKTALASKAIQRVVVSTEDAEIKATALAAGAEVIDRPAELAADSTPTLPTLKHALEELEQRGWMADYVVLLQPTVPYRRSEDIDAAIEMLLAEDADAVVGVVRAKAPRDWIFQLHDNRVAFYEQPDFGRTRRQANAPQYRINGAIYVYKSQTIKKSQDYAWGEKVCGYIMDEQRSLDIDEPFDLQIAELLLASSNQESKI
ncbi:MAG: acylneuraminate cytidylyltransferase family protein [Acidobacteriaceae bacterium]|nr:acylneuraminate cytidylyltransferase family protein [Acidobacteriaceae bacterium]MBV9781850.1 acylneuraminate cytidylyltransferase family protein [Acidobacteriaceae bacterium]